jgi:hypothetical protein
MAAALHMTERTVERQVLRARAAVRRAGRQARSERSIAASLL